MTTTCAEFHRLGDRGVFEGRGAMLIDGVVLESSARRATAPAFAEADSVSPLAAPGATVAEADVLP